MKRILFILSFLYSICSFSQINESFSDGDFNKNPIWQGNTNKFRISADYGVNWNGYGLQLYDAGKAGEAYLSTESSLVKGTTWEYKTFFYGFKPNSNSYAKFYLVSDKPELNASLNGYYIMMGGADKNISLVKQNGTSLKMLISGNKTILNLTQITLLIKVTCSDTGKWTLYSKVQGEDTDWKVEGEATDNAITTSTYAGFYCKYLSGNSTLLYFDDISVAKTGGANPGTGENPDNPGSEPGGNDPNDKVKPTVTAVKALNDSTLSVDFSEEVTLKNARFLVNGDECVMNQKLELNKKKATLSLSIHLKEDKLYELLFWNIEDLNGNSILLSSELFSFQKPSVAANEFGSVIFNEIMANPNDIKGLPESEYIELYNRKDTTVSLYNSSLFYGGKKYALPSIVIGPGKYVVLCHQKYKDLWTTAGIAVVGVSSFPSLLNTGKLLWLENADGNLISWVEYSDSWYKDSKKKSGGYSLECIDPDNLSGSSENWQATNDAKGGTPGEKNSVLNHLPDNKPISIVSTYLQATDTLVVCFNKPMNVASIQDTNNYKMLNSGLSIIESIPDYPCGRNVMLVLSKSLNEGEKLEAELTNLEDVSGNVLSEPLKIEVLQPEKIEVGNVLFNELLFNPRSGGSWYVELSNISDKVLTYNQLYFSYLKEDGTRSTPVALSKLPVSFPGRTETFFTKSKEAVLKQYKSDASRGVDVSDFPATLPMKGTVYLLNFQGDLLDEMVYSESMHTTSLNDKKGISLEKKAPELLSSDSLNWASASFLSGYGTPGYPNKYTDEKVTSVDADFWLERKSFSPSSVENSKLQIRYKLSGDGFVGNIRIFEASGREICSLINNQELLSEGTFEWDGKEVNGTLGRVGLYVAFVEIHNASGQMKKYKLPFALVRGIV